MILLPAPTASLIFNDQTYNTGRFKTLPMNFALNSLTISPKIKYGGQASGGDSGETNFFPKGDNLTIIFPGTGFLYPGN